MPVAKTYTIQFLLLGFTVTHTILVAATIQVDITPYSG
jgi:hypothetical protein